MIEVSKQVKGIVSEAHPDFDKLASPEERAAAERARKMPGEGTVTTSGEIRAKYKIEVRFGPGRTTNGPNVCMVQIWESGKRFHGGGDDKMYWCKNVDNNSDEGCGKHIASSFIRNGIAICPHCKRAINAKLLTGEIIYKNSTKDLAVRLAALWHSLEGSADIYCKYDQTDIRYKAMEAAKGLETARKLRGMHIYPLKNLIKDTSNGAELSGRIVAFLTA